MNPNPGDLNLKDKVCIVTGSNSGIGKETALALAEMGATVVTVVRNKESGEKACSEIIEVSGNNSIDLMLCDLSSMKSNRRWMFLSIMLEWLSVKDNSLLMGSNRH
jgi:NAD(P)-dependent dehydrogenase (short-subunit alcohol dehydrogenase family)